jgi:putative AdoMet-dependent methyltransferase
MKKDYFQNIANVWEQDDKRVKIVDDIATAILGHYDFSNINNVMDFGSGTGLLLEKIAPKVEKITAIDTSPAMNKKLDEKRTSIECDLEILEMDLSKEKLDRKFDGIISSMTMHHVKDIQKIFHKFYNMLNENGVIAIADLEEEDGSFHSEDFSVFHFGFEKESFLNQAKEAGFKNLNMRRVSTAQKESGDFPIFLLTGRK